MYGRSAIRCGVAAIVVSTLLATTLHAQDASRTSTAQTDSAARAREIANAYTAYAWSSGDLVAALDPELLRGGANTTTDSCVQTGTAMKEGRYYILNNCVMRFSFPTSVTIDDRSYSVRNITVVLSDDDEVHPDRDAVLLNREPSQRETDVRFVGSSRIARDGEYIIAQITFGEEDVVTTLLYRYKVRPAPFYWQKLALGAALSYNKPRAAKEHEITPSPILYSALAWGYRGSAVNWLLPRSVGLLVNPDAVAGGGTGDLRPQLVIGVGTSLLDDNIVAGVAWEGGNAWRPRYVIAWKAHVFAQP